MLLKLLLAPLTGPLDGLVWLGEQIQERVDSEVDDRDNLKKRLLALQLAFDMGDIEEEVFEAQEEELLLAIQAMEDAAREEEE
ncbi:MAG: gas vesicle protein GvpG [Leptolyngbyaceae cyanobacterium bins.59]|nr:gas vesicle protein GvpG [Leptolyngbyaceae cyanobacterium bins.59]